jgi:hypothetical protein
MDIVYIDHNDKQRQLYRIYLENILDDCYVHEFFNYDDALEFLKSGKFKSEYGLTLILANTNSINHSKIELNEFFEKAHELFSTSPFCLFDEDGFSINNTLKNFIHYHPSNSVVSLPIAPADFRMKVLEIVYPDRMNLEAMPAFQKIRLFNFFRFNKPHCNVYIKLSRLKYVKVFNEGIKYSRADLERLKEKDVDFLYIRNADFQRFQVSIFRNNFLQFDSQLATTHELKEKLEFSHAMLSELVRKLGFSEEAIELTQKSMAAIHGIIEKEKDLESLINQFQGRDDYLYDHSYLCCVIASDLLKQMKWWSEERFKAIGFAALFHDVTLKNSEIAKVSSKDDPVLEQFDEADVKEYLRHPLEGFDLVSKYPFMPEQVATIICQHHENPEGTGFPASLRPQNIDRLSAVFIVAHEVVNALEKDNYESDSLQEILLRFSKRYNISPFKEVFEALDFLNSKKAA